jgi:hypothetical protein
MKTQSSQLRQSDIEQALTSLTTVFDAPSEVVDAATLSIAQKIEILKRWKLDVHAVQRATEENMCGGERPPLDEVNEALSIVDPEGAAHRAIGKAPTKL